VYGWPGRGNSDLPPLNYLYPLKPLPLLLLLFAAGNLFRSREENTIPHTTFYLAKAEGVKAHVARVRAVEHLGLRLMAGGSSTSPRQQGQPGQHKGRTHG
jgi:hypothetical protein